MKIDFHKKVKVELTIGEIILTMTLLMLSINLKTSRRWRNEQYHNI